MPNFGDMLLWQGTTFMFWEFVDSDFYDCVAEAVNKDIDVFDDKWRYRHLHDSYFGLWPG